MEYQEIVNKCKEAFKNCDLNSASKYWCKLYDILEEKESKFDENDWENKKHLFIEFQTYMNQFTDNEVYTITDYLKYKYEHTEVYVSPTEIIKEYERNS